MPQNGGHRHGTPQSPQRAAPQANAPLSVGTGPAGMRMPTGAPPRPPHGGPPDRRSPLVSALLYGGFALLALLVFAAAFVLGSNPANQIRDRVIAEVKAKTGRDLTITGATSFSFWPTLGLVLHDVALSAPPGMGGEPTASVKTLEVKVKARPLLSREIEVDQLLLREPVVNLRVDAKGQRSWQFTETAAPQRVRYAQAPAGTRTDAPPGAPPAAERSVGGFTQVRDLALGDVRVENGTVRYTDDRRPGATQVISGINARLVLASLDSPIEANGDLVLEGQKVSFDGSLATLQDVMRENPGQLAFNVTSGPLKLKFDGKVIAREQVDLTGAVDASSPSARALLKWLGTSLPPSDGFGPFSVKGQLRAAGKSVALDKATIALDGATASGTIAFETGRERPLIKARLDVSHLDLNKYASDAGGDGARAPKSGPAPAAPAPRAPQSIDDLLKPDRPQVRGYERRNGWSEEPIDTGLLAHADAEATLSIGRVLVREIKIGKTNLQVDLKRGLLATRVVDMALYDGKGRGTVSLDGGAAAPAFAIDLTFEGVSAQPLLRDAASMNWLAGSGNLQLKVAGQGATEKAIIETLDGTAAVQLANGAIVGMNIPQLLRGGGASDKTDFSELSASFTINDGTAQNNDLKLVSPLLRVGGSGSVLLGPRQIDYVARPKVVGSLSGQGGQFNLAGLEVPVKIKGSWDNPGITPDFSGLVKDPSKAVDVVKEISKQLGGKKAGDLLKGLLGGGRD